MKYQTNNKFSEWNFESCLAYVEVLEKAQKFDEVNGEPHCSDPDKTNSLKDLRLRIAQIGLENPLYTGKSLVLINRLDAVIEKL